MDDENPGSPLVEHYADTLSACGSEESDEMDSDDYDTDTESLRTIGSDTEDDDPFVWDDEDTPRNNEPFLGSSGPTFNIANGHILKKFIDDDFFQMIATQTNKYYQQNSTQYIPYNDSEWKNLSVKKMKRWVGLILLMSVKSKIYKINPWSRLSTFIGPVFGKVMKKHRFFEISQFLHFADNSKMPENASRLYKVQSLIDYFADRFKNLYKPSQNLSLVETVIPWGPKSKIKSHIPVNIRQSGLFVRRIHDSATGYIMSVSITENVPLPLETTLAELIEPNWHHLYIDNFFRYNYIKIARNLLSNKIRMCSPVKSGKKLLRCMKKSKPKVNESKFKRKGEVVLQMCKTRQHQNLCSISTIHNAVMVEMEDTDRKNNRPLKMPITLTEYNNCMTGINTGDRYLKHNLLYLETKKWSNKVFVYLLNCALFNAYTMDNFADPVDLNPWKFYEYVLEIAKSWIDHDDCYDLLYSGSEESGPVEFLEMFDDTSSDF